MTTIKLYEQDSHLRHFTARVLGCVPVSTETKGVLRWEIELDQTAFFPEGGGQAADRGTLGQVAVLDVRETNGRVLHVVDAPLVPGETVAGEVDWDRRFPLMQLHSGEHIVSGLVRGHHGYDNVGFHMGTEVVTIDFNGELSEADLVRIETLANEAIFDNLPVEARYPESHVLKELSYRSKREIDGAVRVVSVPGYDDCACCGVHVKRTGEIGLVKLLSGRRYKGGTRVKMVAGRMALRDYEARHRQIMAISAALSAKPLETAQAVLRLQSELDALRHEFAGFRERQLKATASGWLAHSCAPEEGLPNQGRVFMEPNLTPSEVRRLVLLLVEQAQRAAREASDMAASGRDWADWYVVVSEQEGAHCLYAAGTTAMAGADPSGGAEEGAMTDVRLVAAHLRKACGARGGGTAGLVQGSAEVSGMELVQAMRNIPVG